MALDLAAPRVLYPHPGSLPTRGREVTGVAHCDLATGFQGSRAQTLMSPSPTAKSLRDFVRMWGGIQGGGTRKRLHPSQCTNRNSSDQPSRSVRHHGCRLDLDLGAVLDERHHL